MNYGMASMRPGEDDKFAARFFGLLGLGDIGVGVLIFAHPPLLGWLIGQAMGTGGEITARLLGCAAAALGVGWWRARRYAAHRHVMQAGMLLYNFGAGVVFLCAAILAVEPAVPGLIAVTHLALGLVASRIGNKVQ